MTVARVLLRCLVPLAFVQAALLHGQLVTTSPARAEDADCQTSYAARQYREAADCFARVVARRADRSAQSGAELLMEGKSLLRIGDLERAEVALRASLAAAPRTPETLYLLGSLLEQRNQPKESLQLFTEAAALQPPSGEQLRIVARDYVLLGSYRDALHWLERAVAFSPSDSEAWYDLGRVLMHEGRFAEAVTALEKSILLNPTSAKAEDNLGVCLEAQNQSDAAAQAYARAVGLAAAENHPSEQPFIDYGKLLNSRNDFKTALPLLKRATELNSRSSAAFAELSRALNGNGTTDQAVAAMEQAVSLDPDNSRLRFQLGRLYRAAGMAAKAQREFELSAKLYGQKSAE